MNRTLGVLAVLGSLFAYSTPALAQVPLVVGSVRDQRGLPIAGARVTAATAAGPRSVTTEADGTFALPGAGVNSVTITCRFCAPTTAANAAGQPVVVIVLRYAALNGTAPSSEDLAVLPYGHVESAVSLQPFTLLRQTTHYFPGSQLSDRGLEPSDALLIDAGVPNYDVVFGSSPYATIPSSYENSGEVHPASDAFLYGDQAGSGIVTLDPFGGDGNGVAFYGSDSILRVTSEANGNGVALGTSSNWQESRQRTDGELTLPLSSAQSVRAGVGTSQGYQYQPDGYHSAANFSYATATFDDAQPSIDLHANAVYDRGDYTAQFDDLPLVDIWSDSQVSAGVRTRGTVQVFADVASRISTGIYDAQSIGAPRIGAALQQNRIDAGVTATGAFYDATAGVGAFDFSYRGGSDGYSTPSSGSLVTPSMRVDLFPQSKFGATIEATDSFALPTLWQQYAYDYNSGVSAYDRANLYSAQLTYTDNQRVRVSWEEAWQFVHGFTNGQVTSSGVSATWQIAPTVSLRTWTMVASDSTVASGDTPYLGEGAQPGVGTVWLTYQNGSAVRFDAIYRKDVLNGAPFYHFDGDVSGPIANALRWYVGVEDRLQSTHVDAGLQIGR
ncbi:MAG TPA: carboxypeptidase-like regulatory domain-containing protein [Candidatus Baltobacteraceae bacterium]|nr:carboxypeptidase-like regulatory domain-containing protein [Candidatus Baltobacteraceae bacterium]